MGVRRFGRPRFGEAEATYLAAVKAFPENLEAILALARNLQVQKRYPEAIGRTTRCLELARRSENPVQIAEALVQLGSLHREENRLKEAGEALEEALKIYRELAARNPREYLPQAAAIMNNLGRYYLRAKRMEDALGAHEEALKIYRGLAGRSPQSYLPYAALTLNSLGLLFREWKRLEEAGKAFEEELSLYRALASESSETFLPYVAAAWSNMGSLHRERNRLKGLIKK